MIAAAAVLSVGGLLLAAGCGGGEERHVEPDAPEAISYLHSPDGPVRRAPGDASRGRSSRARVLAAAPLRGDAAVGGTVELLRPPLRGRGFVVRLAVRGLSPGDGYFVAGETSRGRSRSLGTFAASRAGRFSASAVWRGPQRPARVRIVSGDGPGAGRTVASAALSR